MGNVKEDQIIVKEYNDGIEDRDEVVYSKAVVEAVRELARLKAQESKLADQQAQCKETIQEFHFNTGARNFDVPGAGNVITYLSSRTSTSAKDLAKWLVQNGASAELVSQGMSACTKTSVSDKVSVRFTPER